MITYYFSYKKFSSYMKVSKIDAKNKGYENDEE